MSNQIEKLNKIYEQHKDDCDGLLHSALWQIMVNESLKREAAAFYRMESHDTIDVVLASGGYIPVNFTIVNEDAKSVLESLNEQVFGLSPEEAKNIVDRSMKKSA